MQNISAFQPSREYNSFLIVFMFNRHENTWRVYIKILQSDNSN